MLTSQALRERSLAVLRRDEQRQRAGVQIVADLQNQPRVLGEWRRDVFGDARQFERFVARRELVVRMIGGGRCIDRYSVTLQRFDEQRAGERVRVGDFDHSQDRLVSFGDVAVDADPPVAEIANRGVGLAVFGDGLDVCLDAERFGFGPPFHVGRLTRFARGDRDVDHVVVDVDRSQRAGSAAGTFGFVEQSVVDEHVTAHSFDAGLRNLRGEIVQSGQRVLRREFRLRAAAGIGVIAVGEGDLAGFSRPSTERQVAAGDEDQIAGEFSFVVNLASANDWSFKAMVGSKCVESTCDRETFRRARGGEELFAVPLVTDLAGFQIDGEQTPMSLLVLRRVHQLADLRRNTILGRDRPSGKKPQNNDGATKAVGGANHGQTPVVTGRQVEMSGTSYRSIFRMRPSRLVLTRAG